MPTTTFLTPPLARVGLNETQIARPPHSQQNVST